MRNKVSQTIPYQFDTAYSPFSASQYEYALDWVAAQGFTGVELAIAYPQKVDAARLLQSTNSRNLSITTLSTGQVYGRDGLYLAAPEREIRDGAVGIIKGHIDLSAGIGFPPVTIGLLRGDGKTGDNAEQLQNFRAAMEECVSYALTQNVRLQIEPLNTRESSLFNTVGEVLAFIDSMGNPDNLGILYDTYHADFEKQDPVQLIQAAGKKLFNIHYADTDRQLPGFGNIDFIATHRAILATGYQGAFALEAMTKPSREFVLEHCKKSIFDIICATGEP